MFTVSLSWLNRYLWREKVGRGIPEALLLLPVYGQPEPPAANDTVLPLVQDDERRLPSQNTRDIARPRPAKSAGCGLQFLQSPVAICHNSGVAQSSHT